MNLTTSFQYISYYCLFWLNTVVCFFIIIIIITKLLRLFYCYCYYNYYCQNIITNYPPNTLNRNRPTSWISYHFLLFKLFSFLLVVIEKISQFAYVKLNYLNQIKGIERRAIDKIKKCEWLSLGLREPEKRNKLKRIWINMND